MNLCSSFSGAALMRDSFIREFDGLRFSGLTDLHVLTQQWTVVSLCWYSSWMGLFTVGQHHCLMCDVSVPILPHLHFLFWVQKWEYLNGALRFNVVNGRHHQRMSTPLIIPNFNGRRLQFTVKRFAVVNRQWWQKKRDHRHCKNGGQGSCKWSHPTYNKQM